MASSYELNHQREYFAIRNAAALIDVSPLFKYMIHGPDAGGLLNRMVTRDVAKCAVHQVMYTPWCDADGKVIDDGTISRLSDDTFRLTSAEPSFWWLHENAVGMNVQIDDLSDTTAALSIQGPLSRDILTHASSAQLDDLKFFRLTTGRIGNAPVTITRTGYTGDLGYEIWLDAKDGETLWDSLIEAGRPYGIAPAGMLAMDMSRVEAGLLLIAVDYISSHTALIEQQKSSPFELGLGWTVKLNKPHFVGRSALVRENREGSAWRFLGVEVEWDALQQLYNEVGLPPLLPTAAWRTSVPLYLRGTQIGYATSGCWSPMLKKYIALAHVQMPHARPGTDVTIEVTVEHRRKMARAKIVKLPFFDPQRKRA